jgi:hypothetical protein
MRRGGFENTTLQIVALEVCPNFFAKSMRHPVVDAGEAMLLLWIEFILIYIVAFRTAFT